MFVFAGLSSASLLFDKGRLLVVPFTVAVFPALDATGGLSLGIPLPNDPSFCGASLYFQMGFVDPGAVGPYHTAQSNGLHWTIGQ